MTKSEHQPQQDNNIRRLILATTAAIGFTIGLNQAQEAMADTLPSMSPSFSSETYGINTDKSAARTTSESPTSQPKQTEISGKASAVDVPKASETQTTPSITLDAPVRPLPTHLDISGQSKQSDKTLDQLPNTPLPQPSHQNTPNPGRNPNSDNHPDSRPAEIISTPLPVPSISTAPPYPESAPNPTPLPIIPSQNSIVTQSGENNPNTIPERPKPSKMDNPGASAPPSTETVNPMAPEASPGIEKVGDVVYFNQHDKKWASVPFGPGNVDQNGCGAVSMAMVVSTLSGHTVNPTEIADWMRRNGGIDTHGSTYHSAVINAAYQYGLTPVKFINPHIFADVKSSLNSGHLIVINGTAKNPAIPATRDGHLFVLRDVTADGRILVADPNSREKSQQSFSPDDILGPSDFAVELSGPVTINASQPIMPPIVSRDQRPTPLPSQNVQEPPIPPLVNRPSPGRLDVQTGEPARPVPGRLQVDSEVMVSHSDIQKSVDLYQKQLIAADKMISQGGEWVARGQDMKHLLEQGWSPEQSAGFTGNDISESGLDPGRLQKDGPAIGLVQWEGGRKASLLQLAKDENRPWTDLELQYRFRDQELDRNEQPAADKIRQATTAEEAAVAVSVYYERPGIPHIQRRKDNARMVFNAFYQDLNN